MRYLLTALCLWHAVCIGPSDLEFAPTKVHRGFFQLPSTERRKHFRDFDLETRYELLIIGSQHVEPPAMDLFDELAESGSEAVPLLRRKLESTKSEPTVRDIVMVFRDMQRFGTYDVRSNASLMALIEKRASEMQGVWKPMTQDMLGQIKVIGKEGKSP